VGNDVPSVVTISIVDSGGTKLEYVDEVVLSIGTISTVDPSEIESKYF